jgi:hypothetical protein
MSSSADSIVFYEDVFEPAFCRHLLKDARGSLTEGRTFTRSNFQWKERVVRSSMPVLVRDYGAAEAALILAQLVKKGLIENDDYHVMNYAWTRLSYIPWHSDGSKDVAVTIYLNDEWPKDWGGIFLYVDEGSELRGRFPAFNSGLKNSANLLHATTPVALDAAEPRYTVQLFSGRRS